MLEAQIPVMYLGRFGVVVVSQEPSISRELRILVERYWKNISAGEIEEWVIEAADRTRHTDFGAPRRGNRAVLKEGAIHIFVGKAVGDAN